MFTYRVPRRRGMASAFPLGTEHQCVSGAKSWEDCGFKNLSYKGFDVVGHFRIVDYGNYEYLAMLECWSLLEPGIWESLNSMRHAWPVLLDLWRADKSERHVERLAGIVEVVMGALRGEAWFDDCVDDCVGSRFLLQNLFVLHVELCRFVQLLNARLSTGYVKHKRQRVTKLEVPCDFSRLWIAAHNSGYPKGVLLCGLLRAAGGLRAIRTG